MLNSNELIDKVKSYNKFLDPKTLSKAYDFALKAHEKQKREEGGQGQEREERQREREEKEGQGEFG